MASEERRRRDGLEITCIGKLYSGPWEKKYWSSTRGKYRYPFPVGFQAARCYGGHMYSMEVREGSRGPLFVVTCEEGITCSGETPSIAWEHVQKKRHVGSKKIRGKYLSSSIDGPQMFGFVDPLVQRLFRELIASQNGEAEQSKKPVSGSSGTTNQLVATKASRKRGSSLLIYSDSGRGANLQKTELTSNRIQSLQVLEKKAKFMKDFPVSDLHGANSRPLQSEIIAQKNLKQKKGNFSEGVMQCDPLQNSKVGSSTEEENGKKGLSDPGTELSWRFMGPFPVRKSRTSILKVGSHLSGFAKYQRQQSDLTHNCLTYRRRSVRHCDAANSKELGQTKDLDVSGSRHPSTILNSGADITTGNIGLSTEVREQSCLLQEKSLALGMEHFGKGVPHDGEQKCPVLQKETCVATVNTLKEGIGKRRRLKLERSCRETMEILKTNDSTGKLDSDPTGMLLSSAGNTEKALTECEIKFARSKGSTSKSNNIHLQIEDYQLNGSLSDRILDSGKDSEEATICKIPVSLISYDSVMHADDILRTHLKPGDFPKSPQNPKHEAHATNSNVSENFHDFLEQPEADHVAKTFKTITSPVLPMKKKEQDVNDLMELSVEIEGNPHFLGCVTTELEHEHGCNIPVGSLKGPELEFDSPETAKLDDTAKVETIVDGEMEVPRLFSPQQIDRKDDLRCDMSKKKGGCETLGSSKVHDHQVKLTRTDQPNAALEDVEVIVPDTLETSSTLMFWGKAFEEAKMITAVKIQLVDSSAGNHLDQVTVETNQTSGNEGIVQDQLAAQDIVPDSYENDVVLTKLSAAMDENKYPSEAQFCLDNCVSVSTTELSSSLKDKKNSITQVSVNDPACECMFAVVPDSLDEQFVQISGGKGMNDMVEGSNGSTCIVHSSRVDQCIGVPPSSQGDIMSNVKHDITLIVPASNELQDVDAVIPDSNELQGGSSRIPDAFQNQFASVGGVMEDAGGNNTKDQSNSDHPTAQEVELTIRKSSESPEVSYDNPKLSVGINTSQSSGSADKQGDSDSLGHELTKSMITLLLPQAVPLLKGRSNRKRKLEIPAQIDTPFLFSDQKGSQERKVHRVLSDDAHQLVGTVIEQGLEVSTVCCNRRTHVMSEKANHKDTREPPEMFDHSAQREHCKSSSWCLGEEMVESVAHEDRTVKKSIRCKQITEALEHSNPKDAPLLPVSIVQPGCMHFSKYPRDEQPKDSISSVNFEIKQVCVVANVKENGGLFNAGRTTNVQYDDSQSLDSATQVDKQPKSCLCASAHNKEIHSTCSVCELVNQEVPSVVGDLKDPCSAKSSVREHQDLQSLSHHGSAIHRLKTSITNQMNAESSLEIAVAVQVLPTNCTTFGAGPHFNALDDSQKQHDSGCSSKNMEPQGDISVLKPLQGMISDFEVKTVGRKESTGDGEATAHEDMQNTLDYSKVAASSALPEVPIPCNHGVSVARINETDDNDNNALTHAGRVNLSRAKNFACEASGKDKNTFFTKDCAAVTMSSPDPHASHCQEVWDHVSAKGAFDASEAANDPIKEELDERDFLARGQDSKQLFNFEAVGCLKHPGPVVAMVMTVQDERIRLCVCCGSPQERTRAIFVYEALVKDTLDFKPLLLGGLSVVLLDSFHEADDQFALEENMIQFTPDGQELVFLEYFTIEEVRKTMSNPGHGVVVASFVDGQMCIETRLSSDKQMHCLLLLGSHTVIAAGDFGCVMGWTMDSKWRAIKESFMLSNKICSGEHISHIVQLLAVPKLPHLIIGRDYNGSFAIWDVVSQTLLSILDLPVGPLSRVHALSITPGDQSNKKTSDLDNAIEDFYGENQVEASGTPVFCLLIQTVTQNEYLNHNVNEEERDSSPWRLVFLRKDGTFVHFQLNQMKQRVSALTTFDDFGVVGTIEGCIFVWNLFDGKMMVKLQYFDGVPVTCITGNSALNVLASAGADGRVVVYVKFCNKQLVHL